MVPGAGVIGVGRGGMGGRGSSTRGGAGGTGVWGCCDGPAGLQLSVRQRVAVQDGVWGQRGSTRMAALITLPCIAPTQEVLQVRMGIRSLRFGAQVCAVLEESTEPTHDTRGIGQHA